jgi:hypothetical protein
MNNQNIISNKFNLFWSTSFSYNFQKFRGFAVIYLSRREAVIGFSADSAFPGMVLTTEEFCSGAKSY